MGTKIYNSDLTKELREGAKIQSATDPTPSELAEKVIPVMEVNPKLLRNYDLLGQAESVTTSSAPGSVVLTANILKETYVTGILLTNVSDVVADNLSLNVRMVVNGVRKLFVILRKPTTTAYSNSVYVSFNGPVKIDRGSTITFVNTFTVGVSVSSICVYGFEVDNINA
jgi:hypothetical protein